MADARGFCPRCGDALPQEEAIVPDHGRASRQTGLCASCYFTDFELVTVPETLSVRICASCGAMNREDGWEDVDTDDQTEMAIDLLASTLKIHQDATAVEWAVEPVHRGPHEIDLLCTIEATVHGERIVEEQTVQATIVQETCTRCGRIAGDYFAATVQLRATDRDATEEESDRTIEIAQSVVSERIEKGDREAFITEINERSEGVDIRVSAAAIGEQIASRVVDEFGGTVASSERLITEDGDGNRVYRVAFVIRLPKFVPGDIIDVEDSSTPVLITGKTEPIRGLHLDNGEDVRLDSDELQNARKIGTRDEATAATVVTIEDDYAVQILDPENYEPVTIRRPAKLDSSADTIPVFRTNSEIFSVPVDE